MLLVVVTFTCFLMMLLKNELKSMPVFGYFVIKAGSYVMTVLMPVDFFFVVNRLMKYHSSFFMLEMSTRQLYKFSECRFFQY